jgi:hypothetical protein
MTEHDHARAIGAPGGPARGRAQKTEKQPHAKAMRRKWLGQGPAPGAAWRRGGGRGFAEISQNNPPERAVKQEFRKTTLRGADVRPGLKNEFRENNPPEGDQSKFPQNNPMQSRWSTRQRGSKEFPRNNPPPCRCSTGLKNKFRETTLREGSREFPRNNQSGCSNRDGGAAKNPRNNPVQRRCWTRAGGQRKFEKLTPCSRAQPNRRLIHRASEHDPEEWEPVFGKDHAPQ